MIVKAEFRQNKYNFMRYHPSHLLDEETKTEGLKGVPKSTQFINSDNRNVYKDLIFFLLYSIFLSLDIFMYYYLNDIIERLFWNQKSLVQILLHSGQVILSKNQSYL